MKKIEDYLHLYLGCGIVVEKAKENFNWVSENPTILTPHILNLQKEGGFSFKPTLRPLSDMTEEEKEIIFPNCGKLYTPGIDEDEQWSPNEFLGLLKQGFDLFGLIPDGLAIDKTKLNDNAK